MLYPGQVYHAVLTVKNQTGAPSSAALAITKPDGTLVTPAPTLSPGTQVGADWVITYDYALPSAGRFEFAWSTLGPGTDPLPDVVNVRAYAPLVGIGEVKKHLNETSADSDRDDELLAFIVAATELVESKVGTCVRQTFTERVTDASNAILLSHYPVLSVTSVTSIQPGGFSWDSTMLIVDKDAGIVSTYQYAPRFWYGPWDVVYTAGRAVIPERFLQACKEQVRHLWETQRGAQPPALLANEEIFSSGLTGMSFSVPRRVLELLEADAVPAS